MSGDTAYWVALWTLFGLVCAVIGYGIGRGLR